jgi:hypothetical protein
MFYGYLGFAVFGSNHGFGLGQSQRISETNGIGSGWRECASVDLKRCDGVRTAACGHLQRHEEASEWVGRIRVIAPQLTVRGIRGFLSGFFVPEALASQVDGLTKAGFAQE